MASYGAGRVFGSANIKPSNTWYSVIGAYLIDISYNSAP